MSTVNMPQPFEGTEEQKLANYASHHFDHNSGRCWECDCRPWGISAHWPCGQIPPRIEVTSEQAGQLYRGTPLATVLGGSC